MRIWNRLSGQTIYHPHRTMKTTITFIAVAALTANVSATKVKEENHEVTSLNGKFKLHVNIDTHTHKITGEFSKGIQGWEFQHDAFLHSSFMSDDGEAAAVVHWAWCKADEADSPAVVIYGRNGTLRSYTYRELSKPRERNPEEVGPIGDFWRVWRGDATINGDVLTIHVVGGKPRVIDLKNPQALTPLETGDEAEKVPQTEKELEKKLSEREAKEMQEKDKKGNISD